MTNISSRIASELNVNTKQVNAAIALLDEGATVPFIARYRKEATGALDDSQLRALEERLRYLRELDARREVILGSIEEQGKLSDALKKEILEAQSKSTLEDLYLPYKPKRRTKGEIAKEAGLLPLAEQLLADQTLDPQTQARAYIDDAKNVPDTKAALEGASGMIAYAPSSAIQIFLSTQVVDEGRHLEVFLHRLKDLGVDDPEAEIAQRANPGLLKFKDQLLEYVDSRDWEAALFAQNVILESLEFTAFRAHAENADPITRQVLIGVIKDERRHMGFGENDLGRRLALTPHLRPRLRKIKEQLDMLVMETFAGTLRDIGAPQERQEHFANSYLATVARLGVEL